MYQTFFFDLDGTLTDPGLGITNSVAYALEKLGIPVPARTELYKFIGPPLLESFRRFYGMTESESENAVAIFREYFRDRGIRENDLIPGVPEMLAELKARGKTVVLATSKPQEFAQQVLCSFDLEKYFDFIAGASFDSSRSSKSAVIRYALDNVHPADLSAAVMVGDREHDVLGAAEHGIGTIGVLFGYGSREELENAGAKHIAAVPADILRWA